MRQFVLAFFVLLGIYLLAALATVYQSGLDGLVGFLIFQPLFGSILVLLTLLLCFLLGLPLRLNQTVYHWWSRQFWPCAVGNIIGVALIGVSFLPALGKVVSSEGDDGAQRTEYVPDLTLLGNSHAANKPYQLKIMQLSLTHLCKAFDAR